MKKERGSILGKFVYTVFVIILLVILFSIYKIYNANNFNGFTKSELNRYSSNFLRDETVKYEGENTYKIESSNFNDAMISKKIEVKPNTPYRVSCMVKIENVETEEKPSMRRSTYMHSRYSGEVCFNYRHIRLEKVRVLF